MSEALSQTQYLTFYIGAEEYGVPVLRVREIIAYGTLTHVPGAPAAIPGVINLRGTVVPVIDLSMRLRANASPITNRSCIVILDITAKGEQTTAGLLADAVSHVVELPPSMIEPPPAFGTTVQLDYLQGMGSSGGRFVLLLDVDKLLLAEEIESTALAGHDVEQASAGGVHD